LSFFIPILVFSVFVTAFVSGVMSLGGGTILMGIFGWVLPVSVAMMLHGVAQIASNGSRGLIYWRHIQWPILLHYFIGAIVCLAFFAWLAYVPDKIVLFLLLGLIPLANFAVPKNYALDITKRPTAIICGFLVSACMLTAGVSGPLLDTFYVKSSLNRFEVHATKGITQSIGHILKIIYYAFFLGLLDTATETVPGWVYLAVIPAAYVGVLAARRVLTAMSDAQFRNYVQTFNVLLGLTFLSRAFTLWLESS
jgi:uncharacterized membrane protein YfcA